MNTPQQEEPFTQSEIAILKGIGRFIDVLIARGIMSEFDRDYIGGEITAEEWSKKRADEISPSHLFDAFGGLFNSLGKENEE